MVREGSVLVTWTAPSLGIRQMGPPTAAIGETVTYRMEVSNPGDLPARDVVASEEVPDGLSFLQANPAPVVEGRRLQWRLGDLAPRQQQIIEATFRTTRAGVVAHCVEVTGAGGLRSSHCANTKVSWPRCPALLRHRRPPVRPRFRLRGPADGRSGGRCGTLPSWTSRSRLRSTAVVGSNVTFDIVLTNRGPATATGIVIRDTFGDGLEHQQRSPITALPRRPGPGAVGSIRHYLPRHPAGTTLSPRGSHCRRRRPAAHDSCVTAVPPASSARTGCVTSPLARNGRHPAAVGPSGHAAGDPCLRSDHVNGRQIGRLYGRDHQSGPAAGCQRGREPAGRRRAGRYPGDRRGHAEGNDVVWSLPSVPPGRPIRLQVQCDCKQAAAKACCRFTATPANGQPVDGQACLEIAAAAHSVRWPPPLAGRDPRAVERAGR